MICTDIGLIRKSKGFTTGKNIAMAMHGEELRAVEKELKRKLSESKNCGSKWGRTV